MSSVELLYSCLVSDEVWFCYFLFVAVKRLSVDLYCMKLCWNKADLTRRHRFCGLYGSSSRRAVVLPRVGFRSGLSDAGVGSASREERPSDRIHPQISDGWEHLSHLNLCMCLSVVILRQRTAVCERRFWLAWITFHSRSASSQQQPWPGSAGGAGSAVQSQQRNAAQPPSQHALQVLFQCPNAAGVRPCAHGGGRHHPRQRYCWSRFCWFRKCASVKVQGLRLERKWKTSTFNGIC